MLFSSSVFLYFFLPAVLLVYFLLPQRGYFRNLFLTIASLIFYAWGERLFVMIMLFSIVVNWQCGLRIGQARGTPAAKRWLLCAVAFDLSILFVFKYLDFFLFNLRALTALKFAIPQISIPLGISFFIFQAISYNVDVYRGDAEAQPSLLNVCMYISLFPQLVAGPIVRYQTVADEIMGRVHTSEDFTEGARRFLVGLAKKVIISNNLALMVDHAYRIPDNGLSVGVAWLGAIFYHVQVFFDFSGYSDMAIGLGRMFGFHFPENFDYPMLSKSVTELWRRWHMSLGAWFRDYVFFPLGGSRVKSKWRLAFNMLVVWALTGLWHGAAWKFLFWGLSFFVLLLLEKLTGFKQWIERRWLGYVYANVAIVVVTVMLRATSLRSALTRILAMVGIGATGLWDSVASMYLREYGLFMLLAVLCSMPTGAWLERKLHLPKALCEVTRALLLVAILVVTLSYVIMGAFNPFIYGNL